MLQRLQCGCVDNENGVGPSELLVDNVDGELGPSSCDTGCSTNCLQVFLR